MNTVSGRCPSSVSSHPFAAIALLALGLVVCGPAHGGATVAVAWQDAPLAEPGCKSRRDAVLAGPCTGSCGRPAEQCGGAASSPSGVYLFSGEFFERVVDLRIQGRGLDFVWARKYRSRIGPEAGLGSGWDYSYNVKILALDARPGEVSGLAFENKHTLSWLPPADPGGSPELLRYCTLRSNDPADFADAATTTFTETDGEDLVSFDTDVPPSGAFYSYLVSAKNGFREGPHGTDSAGVPRAAVECGLTGPDLLLFDGDTRRDIYALQADGTWTAPEFFRAFGQNPDGTYGLAFKDGGTWTFHPFDGSLREGRLTAITDRNGNTLNLHYDGAGRLDTVIDTLGRSVDIAYDANGFIESVTDFTGRQVRYEYYDGFEPGGAFGDLRSVTSPAVTGTPHGNDFPAGKTTIYSYTTGFADERLNHNLATITDPKGQTYLVNEYSTGTDPATVDFDRVVRQSWGDPGDVIDYVYVPQAARQDAVMKTIVNDRTGNIAESFFDVVNHPILERRYTGRAAPDLPTTETDNRPSAPLRVDDPAWFETRWEYDTDSLVSTVVHPNLNEQRFTYDTPNPSRRAQGNLLEYRRLPDPLGGAQPEILETYEYDDGGGGAGGSNFLTRHVDGRGNETNHVYDAEGNRMQTRERLPSILDEFEYNAFGQTTAHTWPDNGSGHRRRDEFTYYTDGHQTGYAHQGILDATGFALTTTYEYDSVGNVIRTVDARGHDTLYDVNQLDQVVRETSREVSPGGERYETLYHYDANDNVVRVDYLNVDDQGIPQPNAYFSEITEYDVLNLPVRLCQETGDDAGSIPPPPAPPVCAGLPEAEFVTTEFEYDANRNRTLVRYGEAAEGRQPSNTAGSIYDERDRLYLDTRAPGDPAQSTTQYDYDPNGNVRRTTRGLEDVEPRVTEYTYDGYDRHVATTDAMGNQTVYSYDPNHNQVHRRTDGELVDGPGDAGNQRLYETTYSYDPLNRLIREEVEYFDTTTQAPLSDGQAATDTYYSDSSQVTLVVDDNGFGTETTYDTANRVLTVTDTKGNTRTYAYDQSSNIVSFAEVDRSDLGQADQEFTTSYSYDGLDRRITTSDNVGNTRSYGYDGRHNTTRLVDALTHATRYSYDGLNRLARTIRDLDGDGADGDGADIETTQTWDDSSRRTGQTDDNGNTTTYSYDPLNRLIGKHHQDGTQHVYTYDAHDNRIVTADANGSISTYSYDPLNRLIGNTIDRASIADGDPVDVIGTTFELYQYDGLSRLVQAQDDDALVERRHDSLSRTTGETLNGVPTTFLYDGVGNLLRLTYPDGEELYWAYDELNRKKEVSDAVGTIATYDWIGPDRVERLSYGNGTQVDYVHDGITGVPNPPGDSGVKQIVGTTHSTVSRSVVIDDRVYTWDAMYNKTRRHDVRPGGPLRAHDYEYDAAHRLVHTHVTEGGLPVRDTTFELDGVGNRTLVLGAPDPGPYAMDPLLPEPADYQVNQYTATSFDSRAHDPNGNLVRIDPGLPTQRDLRYDYRNQMVEHHDLGAIQVSNYSYDPLGRRIGKIIDAGIPDETQYVYDGFEVIEERDATGVTLAKYVYGVYIDEVLSVRRPGTEFFYHADDQYNTVAMTDAFGNVVERYDYQDYGAPEFYDPFGIPLPASLVGNPYLFTGRRYDDDTGLYYFRARYLDPQSGRFTTRDKIGIWGDVDNLGNGYTYAGNNPWSKLDPLGLDPITRQRQVRQTFKDAWVKSVPQVTPGLTDRQIAETHEEGGWIVRDTRTGRVSTRPTRPGSPRDPKDPSKPLELPPRPAYEDPADGKKYADPQGRFEILAGYHTHPNSDSRGPSEADKKDSDKSGIPEYVVDEKGVHKYDPAKTDNKKTKDKDERITNEETKQDTDARNRAARQEQQPPQQTQPPPPGGGGQGGGGSQGGGGGQGGSGNQGGNGGQGQQQGQNR